jgi:acetyl esterase/lipase
MTSTTYDSDGTLHIPAYVMKQSDFLSEEFKRAYTQHLRDAATWPLVPPAVNAPKAEWDNYDAEVDRLLFSPPVQWAEENYPCDIVETEIAGVRVGIVTPKQGVAPENEQRVLINVHGGGFIFGRGLMAGKSEAMPVASVGRIKVITIDYRMAPYHTFPAASEDVEAVYRALLKTFQPEMIGIFGSSAGGVLTAQSLSWFQSKRLPCPGAAGIFAAAPMPLNFRGDSTMWGEIGLPHPEREFSGPSGSGLISEKPSSAGPMDYFKGASMNDPLVNPSISDDVLGGFPSTLWITGTRSFDMSPVIVSHARLLRLHVDSHLYVQEGGQHGAYNIGQHMTTEGRDTVKYIARWFQQHLPS